MLCSALADRRENGTVPRGLCLGLGGDAQFDRLLALVIRSGLEAFLKVGVRQLHARHVRVHAWAMKVHAHRDVMLLHVFNRLLNAHRGPIRLLGLVQSRALLCVDLALVGVKQIFACCAELLQSRALRAGFLRIVLVGAPWLRDSLNVNAVGRVMVDSLRGWLGGFRSAPGKVRHALGCSYNMMVYILRI